jgi:antitoxin PrlF
MFESKITRKGQVTIPVTIRKAIGLNAGERVVFTQVADGTIVLRSKRRSILKLKGLLNDAKGERKVTIDEMNIGRADGGLG